VAAVLKYHAPALPAIKPAASNPHASVSTMLITVERVAPSAMRTPNLPGPLRDGIRHDSVDAGRADNETEYTEETKHQHVETALRRLPRDRLCHRLHLTKRDLRQRRTDG
jgi:hypothetical protein